MSVLYHSSKANLVADDVCKMEMHSVSHVKDKKKEMAKDVHKLAYLDASWLTPKRVVYLSMMVQNHL